MEPAPESPNAPSDAILEVRGLEVTFATDRGVVKAADGVSFDLKPGATLGLVGESGCGKTVTALALLRLVPPPGRITGGRVLFGGDDLLALSERAMEDIRGRRISMVFQEPTTAFNPVLTIGDQIAEALIIHGGAGRERAQAAAVGMLEKVGIPDPAERARAYLFSPGVWCSGLSLNRSGSSVQTLQTYSYGVRPFRVLSRLAKL